MNFHTSTINPLSEFLDSIPHTDWISLTTEFIEKSLLIFNAGGIDIEESDEFYEILKLLEIEYHLVQTRIIENKLQIRKLKYG